MKKIFILIFTIVITTNMQTTAQTKLKPGDIAPDFTAKNQDGSILSLSKMKGKKTILYFYPKDNTPGCTEQACNLRDNYDTLALHGYQILGVSTDDEVSHKGFREKYTLPFPLIADVDKSINQKYGVWIEKERDGKKYMGTARTTFIINEKGIIEDVIDKVDTKQHTLQILKFH